MWIMIKPSLANLPVIKLQQQDCIRAYRPGDSSHWEAIMSSCGEIDLNFETCVRGDPAFRPYRVLYAVRAEKIIGTVLAWNDPEVAANTGYIKYLAVKPQGRDLIKALCVEALRVMNREGRLQAWTAVHPEQLDNMILFLELGFEPILDEVNDMSHWHNILSKIHHDKYSCITFHKARDVFSPCDKWKKDHVNYAQRAKTLRRWHDGRVVAESTGNVTESRGDESLYKPTSIGRAWASVQQVTAGQQLDFTLVYQCGQYKLGPETKVNFFMPGQSPLSTTPQIIDENQQGYLQIQAPNSVELEIISDPVRVLSLREGENPSRPPCKDDMIVGPFCIGFKVCKGYLCEGQEVRLLIGKESGFTWKKLAGRKEIRVFIEPGPKEPTMRLPEPIVIEVIPLDPDGIEVILPGCTSPNDQLVGIARIHDRYDNRVKYDGLLNIDASNGTFQAYCSEGLAKIKLTNVSEPTQVSVQCKDIDCRGKSNWTIPASQNNLYFGDLHAHDFNSTAEGYPAEIYQWARDEKCLDFVSVPVQVHRIIDNEKWAVIKHFNEYFLEEGKFVTFLSFEWQHSAYGDKVIHFLGGDMPYLPVYDPRYSNPPKLYEALRGTDAFIISHHVGYELNQHVPGADWSVMETDIDRLVEIWSMHGSSEGYGPSDRPMIPPRRIGGIKEGLQRGLRFGFVAGSDTHSARPGGSVNNIRPYHGGSCGVWAEKLTRRSLFEAFMARRTYALTGPRIALRFSVNGAMMGSEVPFAEERSISAEVWAPERIEQIEFLRNSEVVFRENPGERHCIAQWFERRLNHNDYYHCRVTQTDGHLAVCSPVWIGLV